MEYAYSAAAAIANNINHHVILYIYNVFRHLRINILMDYETRRSLVEAKIAEAKREATSHISAAVLQILTNDQTPDQSWLVDPVPHSSLHGVGIDEAQGFWINEGKMGSKKDEQIDAPTSFNHDLPSLAKNGPTELPPLPSIPGCPDVECDIEVANYEELDLIKIAEEKRNA
jgi:hypothetical protein